MPTEVILPKVDMDMESGTISVWHVANGETVAQGDPLFDIETDKAAMEVESPASGTLHHVIAQVGDTVPIGRTVAWIFEDGEAVPDRQPKVAKAEEAPKKSITGPAAKTTSESATEVYTQKTRATPAARKLAHASGLSLADITGSGPRNRVQSTDVRALMRAESSMQPAPVHVSWDSKSTPLNMVKSGSGSAVPRLLIHGLGADASAWALLEKDLAAKGPVLRLELPCHGKSPLQIVDNFPHLAANVRATFDTLGIEQAHLVGHSLGAALALALVDTRPRSIKTLTLISPAGLGPQINGDILAGITRATTAASLGPWLRQMVGDPDLITENYAKAAMMARKDPAQRSAQTQMQQAVFPDNTQSFDLTAALHRVTAPTRIIFGKKDQVIPWSHAFQAPGHVSLNLFDNLGHMPQYEDPQAVLALL
ncbi:MAG: acetoin dehydrogenase dihydrolipoyllysine-residue acetyltransferase subunit [Silicimonas sp.]|nr:acetoin dehydrogenase dihydrolipoyllysine-residue acetyltransferase subunit [Silicimonas sp.]